MAVMLQDMTLARHCASKAFVLSFFPSLHTNTLPGIYEEALFILGLILFFRRLLVFFTSCQKFLIHLSYLAKHPSWCKSLVFFSSRSDYILVVNAFRCHLLKC